MAERNRPEFDLAINMAHAITRAGIPAGVRGAGNPRSGAPDALVWDTPDGCEHEMTFDVLAALLESVADVRDWIDYGIRQGWVTEACLTHDGIPSTPEEDDQWENGHDPCQHILRLWPDGKPNTRTITG